MKVITVGLTVIVAACCCLAATASYGNELPSMPVKGDAPRQEKDCCRQPLAAAEMRVGKNETATMERLYREHDSDNPSGTKFTQWTRVPVGNDVEAIWATIGDECHTGAIFQCKDGQLSLVAETGCNRKPSVGMKDGKSYLAVSGSAGGPAWYREVYVFQEGNLIETFTSLEVYGKIDGCSLNGREISADEGNAYQENLPEFNSFNPEFHSLK